MSMRQTSFVKSTSSMAEKAMHPVAFNAGEPTRPYTSGIDCFGAEDGTSVESSTGEIPRPSCAPNLFNPRAAVALLVYSKSNLY